MKIFVSHEYLVFHLIILPSFLSMIERGEGGGYRSVLSGKVDTGCVAQKGRLFRPFKFTNC